MIKIHTSVYANALQYWTILEGNIRRHTHWYNMLH